ncbi:MAG: hypothetical protein RIQ89_1963 [Bacteroidota bacterium]|jgi:hypothetical protein
MKNKQKLYPGILICLLLMVQCKHDNGPFGYLPSTKNVVILIIDGPRYSETWGDSSLQNIPYRKMLKSDGLFCSNFNNLGDGTTTNGCVAITGGYYQPILNSGLQLPALPGLFQQLIKKKNLSQNDACIFASKDKLEVLGNCANPSWQNQFKPYTLCGLNGNGTGYCDDTVTLNRATRFMQLYHPKLTLVHFKDPDIRGHQNDWTGYVNAIKSSDSLAYELWKFIQNDPHYKGNTTLFITNDHGRHPDNIANGFISHGDACTGCRKIELLVLGPDVVPGFVDNVQYDQRDIFHTAARYLSLDSVGGDGKIISSCLK